jgi:predicted Holliday junction resolvase-like endonuclease
MQEMPKTFSFLFVIVILFTVVWIFIRISLRLRWGGGSMTTVVLGATDEFLTEDRKKTAETIVNENAGKKFEDQKIKESE